MGNVGFDKAQVQELCDAIAEIEAVVTGTSEEVKGVLKKMMDESVFDESKQTQQIENTVNTCQKLFDKSADILNNAKSKVAALGEKVGVSIRKREMSMEEQNAAIASASKKVGE